MSQWYLKWVEDLMGQSRVVEQIGANNEELEELNFKPFITVSRDPGSGGKPIAQAVAKKLNFEFYNKKLISEIAKSTKSRKEVISDIDERQRGLMDDLVHNVLNPEYVSERKYIKHLCKSILAVAQKGNVVILGRGSNFITPNAFGLHVRVTAPYRVCVARAVQYEKVPYQKAREIISEVTEERSAFVKQYFGKDIANPKYYDLTLNTTYMTIEDATDIIVRAFKRKLG